MRRTFFLIQLVALLCCGLVTKAESIEVRIAEAPAMVKPGQAFTLQCVLTNRSAKAYVLPKPSLPYFQLAVLNTDETLAPACLVEILELGTLSSSDLMVLKPKTQVHFPLKVTAKSPSKSDLKEYGSKTGKALLSDGMAGFLCQKAALIAVRVYAPETIYKKKYFAPRYWVGDIESNKVKVTIR